MDGVGRVRVADLGLDHHQRNAIDEQDDVRNDAALHAAWRIDPELIDCVKDVALGMDKIDQLDYRVGFTRDLIHVHLSLEQQPLDGLVRLKQRAARVTDDLVAQVFNLVLSEPLLPVDGPVERADRRAKLLGQQPLPKAGPQAGCWSGRDAAMALIDHRPAQGAKLVEERLLYVGVFRHRPPSA